MMYQAEIEMHDGRRFKARTYERESDASASMRQEVRKPGVRLVLLRDLTTRAIIWVTDARGILPAIPTFASAKIRPPAGCGCYIIPQDWANSSRKGGALRGKISPATNAVANRYAALTRLAPYRPHGCRNGSRRADPAGENRNLGTV
jgi:hypothetical protein